MMKVIKFAGLFLVLGALNVSANPKAAEYSQYLKIDLDKPLPSYETLEKKYLSESKVFNRKYTTHYSIGNIFDEAFRITINTYGSLDKRMKPADEETLLEMLKAMPKEMYEYVGPVLHTVPNMSEKILNMPGIKETKNKFPTRIAPQLQHIEDLEFLSPYLYYTLMPEIWPENRVATDIPVKKRANPKVEFDPDYMAKLKKLVPEDEFYPDGSGASRSLKSEMRTISIDADSLLTAADISAFGNTLSEVKALESKPGYMAKMSTSGILLDAYEAENGNIIQMHSIKDLHSPCKRLVQKARIAGYETELKMIVGKEGFDLKGWAYTCDKTLNAYRLSMLSTPMMASLGSFKEGLYNNAYDELGENSRASQYSSIQAMIEMYEAPMSDVLEVRKVRPELSKKFHGIEYYLLGEPFVVYQ